MTFCAKASRAAPEATASGAPPTPGQAARGFATCGVARKLAGRAPSRPSSANMGRFQPPRLCRKRAQRFGLRQSPAALRLPACRVGRAAACRVRRAGSVPSGIRGKTSGQLAAGGRGRPPSSSGTNPCSRRWRAPGLERHPHRPAAGRTGSGRTGSVPSRACRVSAGIARKGSARKAYVKGLSLPASKESVPSGIHLQSARGLAQSKKLTPNSGRRSGAKRFGLRQSPAALRRLWRRLALGPERYRPRTAAGTGRPPFAAQTGDHGIKGAGGKGRRQRCVPYHASSWRVGLPPDRLRPSSE